MFNSLTDQCSIAIPSLQNTFFDQSVILLCQQDNDGAMGLMVNKPISHKLKRLFKELNINYDKIDASILNQAIYAGGPVNQENIFVLHGDHKNTYDSSIYVSQNLVVTTNHQILVDIANNNAPEHFLVITGRSGWSEQQLIGEIKANNWLNTQTDKQMLFNQDNQEKLQQSLQSLGLQSPTYLSKRFGHA